MQEEKDKAQTTINKTDGWYPVARSGFSVPSPVHSPPPLWGGLQGIKCSTSVIEVMQNIQKKACKILIISRAGYSWGPASL